MRGGSHMKQTEERRFADMNFIGKVVFLGKVVVFLASFGFVSPTLFAD
jgi:hypothetical protein